MPGAIVIGAGPGIGTSVAQRLAREGLAVAVPCPLAGARWTPRSRPWRPSAPTASASSPTSPTSAPCARALDEVVDRLGVPEVLVYNAALIQSDVLGELSAAQQLDAWAVNVVGAITAVAHLGPAMAQAGRGTILLTGGMPEPVPEVTSLSLGKAGVRALAQLVARAYEPSGVHVATVTVAGTVAPGSAFDPDEIAEQYWRLHTQPRGAWQREVLYSGRVPAAAAPPPESAG